MKKLYVVIGVIILGALAVLLLCRRNKEEE